MQSNLRIDMKPTPMVLRIMVANVVLWLLFGILINMAGLPGAARGIRRHHAARTRTGCFAMFGVCLLGVVVIVRGSHVDEPWNKEGLAFAGPRIAQAIGVMAFGGLPPLLPSRTLFGTLRRLMPARLFSPTLQ